MKVLLISLLLMAVAVCVVTEGELDFDDTEIDEGADAALKCDACRIVAAKFAESFADIQGNIVPTISPKDEEIIEAAESTCDGAWEGYGVKIMGGMERLTGPEADVKAGIVDNDPIWSRRLQDMCDELLGETPDEKTLFNTWASGNSLEEYLCKGAGTFGACTSDNWGPWPGDDYEDYDDTADFEDIHDEF
ncbi:marginal zone B- and B1-cell-specific protein isoform X2 [Procambarus clarkii]|nr:marginal zone B- and B1-cell-specific protein-like isoform X2 [Procambarus clarkii]